MKKTKTNETARRPNVLRFTPTAWARLLFLRDAGDSEIGGFGIAAESDLLLVEDIGLVHQTASWTHVAFDDDSVADFFDAQVDAGRRPAAFARIWIHTHPGNSPQPSVTDEQTFARVFGHADWALMFILARGGQSYARLRFNVGPTSDQLIPVDVDYGRPFAGTDHASWQAEYEACVVIPPPEPKPAARAERLTRFDDPTPDDWRDGWYEYADFDHPPQEADYGYVRDF